MKNSFEKSVRLAFILVCGLLAWIAVEARFDTRRAQEALSWSQHSRDVLTQIGATLSTQQDIEIGVRGYLLTGNESYLEPYRHAQSQAAADVARLKELAVDSPLQIERAHELQGAVERNLAASNSMIATRSSGNYGLEQIQKELANGKQAMDQIRAILADMHREELDIHTHRRETYNQAVSKTLWTLGVLAGFMFLLFVISYSVLERHLFTRRRAEEALRESEDRVRLLLDSTAEAICGIDRNGLCTFANRTTLKMFGYPAPESLLGRSIHNLIHHSRSDGSPYPAQECPFLQVVEKGVPVHSSDETLWRADGSSFAAECWSYPMLRGGEVTGAVETFVDITDRKRSERALQEANLKLSQEFQQTELRNQQITAMSQMAAMLQSCTLPEEAFQIIGQVAQKLFPGVGGALCVISPSRDVVEVSTEWGDPALGDKVFPPMDCWALRSGRPHLVNLGNGPTCRHVAQDSCASAFCVPMMALGESIGILFMSHATPGCGMDLPANISQHNLVIAFAENVSLALANLHLRETLRMQSIRDPLTSLYNRRYMEEFFEREVKRAARSGKPIGVILFDLDHFKRYNDTFGHEAGDVLLKEASGLFRALVRGDDVACRYGGEEFLLLMPETTQETACQRAENLRNTISHLHVQHRGQALGSVSISAGVAMFPEHGTTPSAVLRAADQALYRAKESGRNRVIIADQVLSG